MIFRDRVLIYVEAIYHVYRRGCTIAQVAEAMGVCRERASVALRECEDHGRARYYDDDTRWWVPTEYGKQRARLVRVREG